MTIAAQSKLTIRSFSGNGQDYEAAARILSAVSPDHEITADQIRDHDRRRGADRLPTRIVAESGGNAAGLGMYMKLGWSAEPDTIFMHVCVHPDHQRQRIGGAIYDELLEAIDPLGPRLLWADAREDRRGSTRFLMNRGFEEAMRTAVSRLALAEFDGKPFLAKRRSVLGSDLTVCSLDTMMGSVPDWQHRCWDLLWEIRQDIPNVIEPTRPSLERFVEIFDQPNFTPEGWFIARAGDSWVGLSNIWPDTNDASLFHTGATGVVRSHRRRGIATALKLCAIEFVRTRGGESIETSNEENNPMLDLNRALGFKAKPATVSYTKACR